MYQILRVKMNFFLSPIEGITYHWTIKNFEREKRKIERVFQVHIYFINEKKSRIQSEINRELNDDKKIDKNLFIS